MQNGCKGQQPLIILCNILLLSPDDVLVNAAIQTVLEQHEIGKSCGEFMSSSTIVVKYRCRGARVPL